MIIPITKNNKIMQIPNNSLINEENKQMNINILSQNIVNNPRCFTAQQIKNYFEEYARIKMNDQLKLQNDWLMVNTSLDVEKVVDFIFEFKQVKESDKDKGAATNFD